MVLTIATMRALWQKKTIFEKKTSFLCGQIDKEICALLFPHLPAHPNPPPTPTSPLTSKKSVDS